MEMMLDDDFKSFDTYLINAMQFIWMKIDTFEVKTGESE